MTEVDSKLRELLAEPERAVDEAFVARVDRAVAAEQAIVARQAAMWRRFFAEAAGSAAVVGAFYLLSRMAPSELSIDQLTLAPVIAASMVLFLWFGVELRPAITGK